MKLPRILKDLLVAGMIFLFGLTFTVQAINWDNEKFMSLDGIEKRLAKERVKGKCKTVFKGTEVEEFDIEVLSIERNAMPNWDVIWVKGKGGSFDETGIAGGMSGSPCYIDGKLFGAVSLGFFWQKKGDILGVTPIEEMIKVTEWGMTPKVSYSGGLSPSFGMDAYCTYENDETILSFHRNTDLAMKTNFESFGDARVQVIAPPAGNKPNFPHRSDVQTAHLEIPVSFSGISSRAMELLNPFFSKYNMVPIQGAGSGKKDINVLVEPGIVLGMEYARGDFTAFAYGTLTYKENGQFLAYGHPAMGEGNVNLPVSSGYVHFIVPSYQRSSKVASAAKPIGTIVQDRVPAIAGTLGDYPSYIPVDIQVKAENMPSGSVASQWRQLHFEVVRHKSISAGIVMSGVWSIVDGVIRESGDYTVDTHATISFFVGEGFQMKKIEKRNVYSGSGPGFGALQILRPLSSLIDNDFQPIHVDNITVDIQVKDKRNFAIIESALINKERYRPGEEIKIDVTIRPYLENPVVTKGSIKISENMPDGEYNLLVSSATSHEAWQRSRAPLNFRPTNVNQLIEMLQRGESNDSIIFELFAPKRGMTVEGEELPELPISMLSVLNSPIQTGGRGLTKGTTLLVEKLKTDYNIGGSKMLKIIVDRNAW